MSGTWEKHGEYYMDEDGVTHEDRRQNHRLRELEEAVSVMRSDISGLWKVFTRLETALIGPDGNNGIRGTMQEQYRSTNDRMVKVETKIEELTAVVSSLAVDLKELSVTLREMARIGSWIVGATGVIIVIFQILSYFQ